MDDQPATRPSLLVSLRDPHDDQAWSQFVAIYSPLVYRFAQGKTNGTSLIFTYINGPRGFRVESRGGAVR